MSLMERPAGLSERRLTVRVRKTWTDCANGRLPSWDDIAGLELGDDWRWCFAIDLMLSHSDPYFIFLGDAISQFDAVWVGRRGERQRVLVDTVADCLDEAIMTRKPASLDISLPTIKGGRIALRSVVLPLSENGMDVTHAFGAANGRIANQDADNSL